LFPELRISQASLFDIESDDGEDVEDILPDLLRVMDIQQEQLARSLGEGHRVIHGVAGAGKTLILVYRCLYLAQVLSKPILVLCYNRSLAARLQNLIDERGLNRKVHVRNFHKWCRDQLVAYNEPLPPDGPGFSDGLVQGVIEGVDGGRIPAAQYGAVMIDEGHDFQPEWFKLTVQMVDPDTNSLLVLYDDAQSIYGRRQRKFSFASVGIQAQGRTTILRLNYRNTDEVLAVAAAFARELLTEEEAEEDGVPLIAPTSAGRRGPPPMLVKLPQFDAETVYISERLQEYKEKGRAWRDMAVVYRSRFMGDKVATCLSNNNIPYNFLSKGASRTSGDQADAVKLITMHSSKGLEFPVVFIPGLGFMPGEKMDDKEEARLLYVAATRAMDELIITGHKDSAFVIKRQEAVSAVA
jgi:superfamily I DNA/RNA helicase